MICFIKVLIGYPHLGNPTHAHLPESWDKSMVELYLDSSSWSYRSSILGGSLVTDKLDSVCPRETQRLDHCKEPPLGSSLWNCFPSVNILDLSFLLLLLHSTFDVSLGERSGVANFCLISSFCGSSFLSFFLSYSLFWISYDQRAGLEVNLQSINIFGLTNCLKVLCPSWKFDMSIWLCGYLENWVIRGKFSKGFWVFVMVSQRQYLYYSVGMAAILTLITST